jgi:fatty-acid desaturase
MALLVNLIIQLIVCVCCWLYLISDTTWINYALGFFLLALAAHNAVGLQILIHRIFEEEVKKS